MSRPKSTGGVRRRSPLVITLAGTALALLAPGAAATAAGPSTACPDTDRDDVVFEIRVRHIDWDPFFGGDTTVEDFGWTVDGVVADVRDEDDGPRMLQSAVEGTVGEDDLGLSLSTRASVFARRVDGHIFGCGSVVDVRVWVKGLPGTPWHMTTRERGELRATFPDGLGRSAAEYGPFIVESVNGAGLNASNFGTDVDGDGDVDPYDGTLSTIVGATQDNVRTFEPGGPIHSLAIERTFVVRGGVAQSINFCFPSCGTFGYFGEAYAEVSIEAGIGAPNCTGTIDVEFPGDGGFEPQGACGSPDRENYRVPFVMHARIDGDCGSCRYRQFVREFESYYVEDGRRYELPTGRPGGTADPDCLDEIGDPSGACPALDARCWPFQLNPVGIEVGGVCLQGDCIAEGVDGYGDRQDEGATCHTEIVNDGYYDPGGAPNLSSGCIYRGFDAPGAEGIPIDRTVRLVRRLEFVGQIVTSDDPPVVVAQRRWEVDIDAQNDGVPAPAAEPLPTVRSGVDFPGRLGGIAISLVDATTIRGSIVVGRSAADGDAPPVSIDVLDATRTSSPRQPAFRITQGPGTNWVLPFEAEFDRAVPPVVALDLEFLGELVEVDLDLSDLVGSCPLDVDGSGAVDLGDILVVLAAWGPCPGCAADLDASGGVDFADLVLLLAAWGPCG